jgi:hypothetical protein
MKSAIKQLLSWGYNLQRRGVVQEKVILLGHMRCGSSLMVHILASNPEIAGYGETHLKYRTSADLENLATNVYFELRRLRPSRLVLDKVLHNEYLLIEELLLAESCTFPIMAREAISSVTSMVASIPGRLKQTDPDCDDLLAMAADYYLRRLDMLCHYGDILAKAGKCWYFTYHDLLESSGQVFRMLEKCLKLRQPLSEQYTIGSKTGLHGYGDPSTNIKRGYIDRSIVRNPASLPEKLAETLTERYRSFDTYMRGISTCIQRKSSQANPFSREEKGLDDF